MTANDIDLDNKKNLNVTEHEERRLRALRTKRIVEMRKNFEAELKDLEKGLMNDVIEILQIDKLLRFIKPLIFAILLFLKYFGTLVYPPFIIVTCFLGIDMYVGYLDEQKSAIFKSSFYNRQQVAYKFATFGINSSSPDEQRAEFFEKSKDIQFRNNQNQLERELLQTNVSSTNYTLAPHPDPALVEATDDGILPKISEDGRKASLVYARPYDVLTALPSVGIVIQGLGLSYNNSQLAMNMHPNVSLSFSPYSSTLKKYINEARDKGHEVFLDLPMEPNDYPRNDAGPLAITSEISETERLIKLRKIMAKSTGYVGFVPYMGEQIMQDKEILTPVLRLIQKRGLQFLDVKTSLLSQSLEVMDDLLMEATQADLTIHNPALSTEKFQKYLEDIEKLAKKNGNAIIIIKPYMHLMQTLARWIRNLETRDIMLLPTSAIINKRYNGKFYNSIK